MPEIVMHPRRCGKTQNIPASYVKTKFINDPAEAKYINDTRKKLESLIGDDFSIFYNGDLSWTIKPLIKHIEIIGTIIA